MKKKSDLQKLLDYAGNFRWLTYASWVLSVISALLALVPFIYIWKIIKEVLDVAPNYENATTLTHNGIMAVVFAVGAMLVYIGALMCSHIAAFRVQANIRSNAPYRNASARIYGRYRKRQNEKNRQRSKRRNRNVSGAPTARLGGGHGNAHMAYRIASFL